MDTNNYSALAGLVARSGLTGSDFLTWVNTPAVTPTSPVVPVISLVKYMMAVGVYGVLQQRATTPGSAESQVLDFLGMTSTVDFTDPLFTLLTTTLVSNGTITSAQLTASVTALTTVTETPAQAAGLGNTAISSQDLTNLAAWQARQIVRNQWGALNNAALNVLQGTGAIVNLMDLKNQAAALAELTGQV